MKLIILFLIGALTLPPIVKTTIQEYHDKIFVVDVIPDLVTNGDFNYFDFVLPNGVPMYDLIGDYYVQRVKKYTLEASDIIHENIQINNTWYSTTRINYQDAKLLYTNGSITGGYYIEGHIEISVGNRDNPSYNGYYISSSNEIVFVVSNGTYASLGAAKADLAGTDIYYQLATPINRIDILELKNKKQYSPLYSTTFDLMSDAQIKLQLDEWVQNNIENGDIVLRSVDFNVDMSSLGSHFLNNPKTNTIEFAQNVVCSSSGIIQTVTLGAIKKPGWCPAVFAPLPWVHKTFYDIMEFLHII